MARTTLAAAAASEDTCADARTAQRLALLRYRRRDGTPDRPSARPARARCGVPLPDNPPDALPDLDARDRLPRFRRRGGFRGWVNTGEKADAGVEGAGIVAEIVRAANERGGDGDCGEKERTVPAYLVAAMGASVSIGAHFQETKMRP